MINIDPHVSPPATAANRAFLDSSLREILRCPDCKAALSDVAGGLVCAGCDQRFPIDDGIPDLLGRTDTVNLDEVATQDHVSDLYEEARYLKPHAREFHRQNVVRMCGMVRLHGRVLDNGCGNGFFFDACRGLVEPGVELVGLDISRGMLAKARGHHDRLVRGDSTRLPFADGTFDAVFARSLLHHLPDPDAGVREIARVLRPGGEVVVLDTHKTVVSALPRTIANRGEHFDEDHKNFRTSELTGILGRHLVVEQVEYMGYLAYPLLGFPDLFDFEKVLPLGLLAWPLLGLDRALARTPGVRRLGWGVIVKARRAR